ncbi:transcriptional regulator [Oceanisphaera marina]|uniref:N-acetylglucosamine kinase n=1 Tax=Oceanisphaera marina TaxID=2017550 RepID=A0ABQ1IG33_9GAMM|nr:ROK family protein [Oceanisphaera marina]GGB39462.1 transcriptional regulator [Oceanisphaera marina]
MYYGVDIGGSKIAMAAFDEQGQEQERFVYATPQNSYSGLMGLLCEWITQADLRWQARGSVGVGFPGIKDAQGRLLAANVPAIHGQHLQQDLQQQLARPVYADNDANCFLLSEYHGGAAHNCDLALALTLGTGLGGALIHQGLLVNSRRGGSAEFGHGPVNAGVLARYPDLPLFACGCGLRGCLETYVSGTGLARLYQHVSQHPPEIALSGPAIIAAWQQGDAHATHTLSLYLDILASGLGCLMTQLDPDMVVLGGGLSEHAWLYKELNARLPHYLMRDVEPAPVMPAVFGGSGGVRGAALLAKRAI